MPQMVWNSSNLAAASASLTAVYTGRRSRAILSQSARLASRNVLRIRCNTHVWTIASGHVVSIAPFLGFFSGLLFVIGVIVTVLAAQIGFGAVLLTRGGRRREYYGSYDADAAWAAAMGMAVGKDSDTESNTEG